MEKIKNKLTYTFAALVAVVIFIFSSFVGGGVSSAYAATSENVTACTVDTGNDNIICSAFSNQPELQAVDICSDNNSLNYRYLVHGYLYNGGPALFYSDILKYRFSTPIPNIISVSGLTVIDMWTEVVSYDEFGFECVICTTNDSLFCKELYAEVLIVVSAGDNTANTGSDTDDGSSVDWDYVEYIVPDLFLDHINVFEEIRAEYVQNGILYSFDSDEKILEVGNLNVWLRPYDYDRFILADLSLFNIVGSLANYNEDNLSEVFVFYDDGVAVVLNTKFYVEVTPCSRYEAVDIIVEFEQTKEIYSNSVFYEVWGVGDITVKADFGDGNYVPVEDFSISGDLSTYDENNLSEVVVTYGDCQRSFYVEVIPNIEGNKPTDGDGDNLNSGNTCEGNGENSGDNTGADGSGKNFNFGVFSFENFKNLFDKDFWAAFAKGEIGFPNNFLSLVLGVIGIVLFVVLLSKFISLFSKKNKGK